MNSLFAIENARVEKLGQYTTGNSNDKDGNPYTWHTFPCVVSFDYTYNDPKSGETHGTQSMAVKFRAENALWAKDNLHTGMVLNLWVRSFGGIRAYNAGGQYKEAVENNIIADYVEVVEQPKPAQAPGFVYGPTPFCAN